MLFGYKSIFMTLVFTCLAQMVKHRETRRKNNTISLRVCSFSIPMASQDSMKPTAQLALLEPLFPTVFIQTENQIKRGLKHSGIT